MISGINYSWSIVNNIQLFLVWVMYIFPHIIIYLLYRRYKQLKNIFGRLVKCLFEIMTFNIYARSLIEGYLFLYLSTIHEIYLADFTHGPRIVSYVFGIFIYITLIFLAGFVVYQWHKSLDSNFDIEKCKFAELFEGLKENKCGKFFHAVFIFRRVLSASWIVLAQFNNKRSTNWRKISSLLDDSSMFIVVYNFFTSF